MKIPPPPEWAPVKRIWTAWPWDRAEWGDALEGAKTETAAFVRAVADGGTPVALLVRPQERAEADDALCVLKNVAMYELAYGDIWLRDTGPVLTADGAAIFRFNGWGGKYRMEGDETVADFIAAAACRKSARHDFVFEGGAIDHDGTGLAITTEQCLLNRNRNPDMRRGEIEDALLRALGIERLVWLREGLANDHTDGHVDNLARFVAPGRAIIPQADGDDDPNTAVFEDAAVRLAHAGIEVARIPSAGPVIDDIGQAMPASYTNFLISNDRVVVPQFGVPNDAAAVAALGTLFPGRIAVGSQALHILRGGGAFHCMSREEPDFAQEQKA